jgi:NADH-quinone oxidoreductase subunit G
VKFGSGIEGAKYICLGDYANSRGAADMGLYPDLLPGYAPISEGQRFADEWDAGFPDAPGMNLQQMLAPSSGLKALYVVGSNPVARYGANSFGPAKPFLVVQDLFLTETATMADVVLPAACAYEKSGTFTNTCGDVQLVNKAGDLMGVKPDFEIMVQLASRMGFDVRKLVPFRGAGRADLGQSRGAQSGEADRHAVWLRANNLEPKVSPLDPMAILDEIQRLVPGYDVSRLELIAGNDVHTHAAEASSGNAKPDPAAILASNDTLFTSGTLGRYSEALSSVIENKRREPVPPSSPAPNLVAGD